MKPRCVLLQTGVPLLQAHSCVSELQNSRVLWTQYCMLLIILAVFLWLQGSTVSSQSNTVPIYILNSGMCLIHPHASIHLIFATFLLHTAEGKTEVSVVKN